MQPEASFKHSRRITLSLFGLALANLVFHSVGLYIFDFSHALMSSRLAIADLLTLLSSTAIYADDLPQFSEFVLVQLGFMAICAIAILLLLARRAAFFLGANKSKSVENKSVLIAIVFFFWIGLHPYVLPWPTGNENDNTLVLSLYFQMSVQSALWAMTTSLAIGCLFFPERINSSTNKLNKGS